MSNTAQAAKSYDFVDDLWIVTSYFNPVGYQSKLRNYEKFRAVIEASGLNLLTIECAFGNNAFELGEYSNLLRVRASDCLWQKERLLNLAITQLPARCAKVAWLDCDILFENPAWALRTSQMLEQHPVVQPFEVAIRLPEDISTPYRLEDMQPGFGFVHAGSPHLVREGSLQLHGHTGFAWAARRETLADGGLYDACVAGGGDHLMAHAMCNDWDSACIHRNVQGSHLRHFVRWGEVFYARVLDNIGHVPGAVLHLWHGDLADRRYTLRQQIFKEFEFDPVRDVKIGESGCWEWLSDKPEMHRWLVDYFIQRREDGGTQDAVSTALQTA